MGTQKSEIVLSNSIKSDVQSASCEQMRKHRVACLGVLGSGGGGCSRSGGLRGSGVNE